MRERLSIGNMQAEKGAKNGISTILTSKLDKGFSTESHALVTNNEGSSRPDIVTAAIPSSKGQGGGDCVAQNKNGSDRFGYCVTISLYLIMPAGPVDLDPHQVYFSY